MAIFDFRFHHPNPWIDDLLHGDHTHTNEDSEEVVSPGTPDRPVVIEPDPEPDPAPNPNPGPAPATDPEPEPIRRETHEAIQIGGAGDDTLTSAGYAYNLLDGKGGNDTLVASGSDHVVMIGGPGNDIFDITQRGTDGGPVVFIMDFETPNYERGPDRIRLEDGDDSYTPLLDFYNRVSEAGLTFDMAWIAKSDDDGPHGSVTLSWTDDKELVLVEGQAFDEGLGALSLEVIDGDLFIVSLG